MTVHESSSWFPIVRRSAACDGASLACQNVPAWRRFARHPDPTVDDTVATSQPLGGQATQSSRAGNSEQRIE